MSTPDDRRNYVEPTRWAAGDQPLRHCLKGVHRRAAVHKKTLVIMADSALSPRAGLLTSHTRLRSCHSVYPRNPHSIATCTTHPRSAWSITAGWSTSAPIRRAFGTGPPGRGGIRQTSVQTAGHDGCGMPLRGGSKTAASMRSRRAVSTGRQERPPRLVLSDIAPTAARTGAVLLCHDHSR